MRRAGLLALLLLVVAALPALAASPRTRQRSERVRKGMTREDIHMYWAQMASQREVLIIVYEGEVKRGDEFDIVDQRGYAGRARVTNVQVVPMGCPGSTYKEVVATLERGQLSGSYVVAFAPLRRKLDDARVLMYDEIKKPPKLNPNGTQQIDVGVDLDGDKEADLVRVNYECPAKTPGQAPSWCLEVMARRGDVWSRTELTVVQSCY
jgi:hypothetical protein